MRILVLSASAAALILAAVWFYARPDFEPADFHASTHRAQSVVILVSQGAKTLEEINQRIPPHNVGWTETILQDVIAHDWVKRTASKAERYELSERGQRMLAALEELPEDAKRDAWSKVWGSGKDEPDLNGESDNGDES